MKSADIRRRFIEYFTARGHEAVASSSLVPYGDETILFTNAGMNQFKNVFLGRESRAVPRAVTSQKCMRVSGKHNDLENVGRTPRHHTFFEMLGNFSFGDYFKKEAIAYAWEFLTKEMGMDPARMWATVYEDDAEAYDLWLTMNVLPKERILKLGKDDNFWAMGETGPCGPCSEIHYDFGDTKGNWESDFMKGSTSGQIIEIWNLVFMQFNRSADGTMTPLSKPCIDTGMGLERLCAVAQGKRSNYETDLFTPILDVARRMTEARPAGGRHQTSDIGVSLHVIADHVRALTFLISDGVIPSNEGRGYVLRKIMRRAMKHGRYLGLEEPFLWKMVETVVAVMGEAYPELRKTRAYVEEVCRLEETRFADTLAVGLERLRGLMERAKDKKISGKDAFTLYDTYGFPLDLAQNVAEDYGFTIDTGEFERCMEEQRETARKSWKGAAKASVSGAYAELAAKGATRFCGYDTTRMEKTEVLALLQSGARVEKIPEGQEGEVVLSATPFYAEAGGQVGDTGTLEGNGVVASVLDAQRPAEGLVVHRVKIERGTLRVGDFVRAEVDAARRRDVMANHTATHLLHAALREFLGEHVKQAGSLVAPDRLRFDFSHFKAVSWDMLKQMEARVNEVIRANEPLRAEELPLNEALKRGAMALFGEKYGERVRVISIADPQDERRDFSVELCGGTHTRTTGEIGLFKFVEERAVASGARRVEALTGRGALERIQRDWDVLTGASEKLSVPRDEILKRIEAMREQTDALRKETDRLKISAASAGASSGAADTIQEVAGVKILTQQVDGLDAVALRTLSDHLLNKIRSGVVVIGCTAEGKATLLVAVSKDLASRVPAGDIVKRLAPIVGGTGGGKPTLAQAGGKDASKLAEALAAAYAVVKERVG